MSISPKILMNLSGVPRFALESLCLL